MPKATRAEPNRPPRAAWLVAAAAVVAVVVVGIIAVNGRPGPLPASGDVTNRQAQALIERGARVVDVRSPEEFVAGHIPGAENVPVDQVAAEAKGWDKGEPILVYCATGARSSYALQQLQQAGFEHVYNLKAGIVAWEGEVTSGSATQTASGLQPLPSGLPALYEFYTDW
ncbi:MAG: rhodanese-like domain-containing protein [Coriobacteriia bacterium]|nr:rhodanese-like domain-containing protein [Coriobacteriia bacterium]